MIRAQVPVTEAVTIDVADHRPPWAVYILTKVVISPTTEFKRHGLDSVSLVPYT